MIVEIKPKGLITVTKLLNEIENSLKNDASTWIDTGKKMTIQLTSDATVNRTLFTHKEKQYQNEEFYFIRCTNSVQLKFKPNKTKSSTKMIAGMLTYYVSYNLDKVAENVSVSF